MKVKVGFDESSKAVTAHVQIEGEDPELAFEMATMYMDRAMEYATTKSMRKLRS